jgi:hypothetical protein
VSNSTRTRDIVGLIAFLGLCLAVLGIGGAATTTSVGNCYQTLVTTLWQLN